MSLRGMYDVRDEGDHMVKEYWMLWNIITTEDNLEQETVIWIVLKLKDLYEKEYLWMFWF